MGIPSWQKLLAGQAGEQYVAAELSKRMILNAFLPPNFSGNDIMIGQKGGSQLAYIQVKSCHPDHGETFLMPNTGGKFTKAPDNEFVVFVWLGSPFPKRESPEFWIATKKDVGEAMQEPSVREKAGRMCFFRREDLTRRGWKDNWAILRPYLPLPGVK